MYHKKKKIKSFTLTEVMVALLISSIAFSLAIFSLLNIQKQIYKFQLLSNSSIEKEHFFYLLNKDFQENIPQKMENNILTISSENKTVQYELFKQPKRIQAAKIDTFSLQINSVNYFINPSNNTVHLDIVIDKNDSLHFQKELGIHDIINNTPYGISN